MYNNFGGLTQGYLNGVVTASSSFVQSVPFIRFSELALAFASYRVRWIEIEWTPTSNGAAIVDYSGVTPVPLKISIFPVHICKWVSNTLPSTLTGVADGKGHRCFMSNQTFTLRNTMEEAGPLAQQWFPVTSIPTSAGIYGVCIAADGTALPGGVGTSTFVYGSYILRAAVEFTNAVN